MAQVTIQGIVQIITEPEQVTDKMRKLDIIAMEASASNWPNIYKMQAINKMIDSVASIGVGDAVMFTCEVLGRVWTKDDKDSYFTNLNIADFRVLSSAGKGRGHSPAPSQARQQADDRAFEQKQQKIEDTSKLWDNKEYDNNDDNDGFPF